MALQVHPVGGPDRHGLLDVGDGQRIYWEIRGNPAGRPAVMLHGGPGSGGQAPGVRYFDPAYYRVVTFDQRGCGRSDPHAGELAVDLTTNTTAHLVRDIEELREYLGIERWLVWGASWGVTLALAYAERHSDRVTEMLLLAVTLTRRRDVEWITHGAGRFFPEQWERFRSGVPASDQDDLAAGYDRLLNGRGAADDRVQAALDWCAWEDALLSLEGPYSGARRDSLANTVCFARLVTHYFAHAAWLEDDELLRDAYLLSGIPGVLVHGRFDLASPVEAAWQLAAAWPGAQLHLHDAGHGGDQQAAQHLLAAAARFSEKR